jgi:RecB family exonuclease
VARSLDVYIEPYGPRPRETLRDIVAAAKSADPMTPVTVAVPSNYAGLSLRRWLAAEGLGAAGARGVANIRFLVLPRIIELLGAPRLAALGRRPLASTLRIEALRTTLEGDPGPFGTAPLDSRTLANLDTTFEILRLCTDAQLDSVTTSGALPRHIVGLYRDYRSRVRDFYDEGDLAAAAADAVRADPAIASELGTVVSFLPGELSGFERRFIDALAEATDVAVVLGATGDPSVDEVAQQAWSPLADGEAASPPIATRIVQATDPEEEVREAVRHIAARLLEGTSLPRMAILYRHANPYARIAGEQLEAAKLPWNGPALLSLGQTVAGRTLLGFLGLPAQRFRREAVAGWLNSAPVLNVAGGEPAPSHRWEEIARRAGVVRGEEQWLRRLDRFVVARRAELAELQRDGDDEERQAWRAGRLEREIAEAGRLRRFVEELAARAHSAPAGNAPWSAFAGWALEALDRYLGGHSRTATWPQAEVEAYEAVAGELQALGGLDEFGDTDAGRFLEAVERALEAPAGRTGHFGNGVFVGRLADVTGLDFDTVFVLGNTEGAMSPAGREDPLLPEEVRRRAGIEGRAARLRAERRDYLAALAAAPERVLLFPRADVRGQRAQLPGRWLLESASALAGERVFASRVEELRDASWFAAVASFEAALRSDDATAASEQEYDLRSLLQRRATGRDAATHYLVAHEPHLARGWALQTARRTAAFTRWDGNVAGVTAPGALSPTALQNWAECPFRFFMAQVLRVSEQEETEDVLVISPLERGSLIHRILERFFTLASPRTAPEERWSDEEHALLRDIAREECEAAEADGIAGRALLWELERDRILADLEQFLAEDEALRAELGTVQVASELAFGLDGAAPLQVDLPGGGQLLLRGRIDRLDRSADGRHLVVIDYKTGRVQAWHRAMSEDPVQRGRLLQLPIYALAAAHDSGRPLQDIASHYWFVTHTGGFALLGYTLDDTHETRSFEALDLIARGIQSGVFPARPGKLANRAPEHCMYCPYDPICPADRGRAWERKRGDAALAEFVAFTEPDGAA